MHRQARMFSILLIIGLMAGCLDERASDVTSTARVETPQPEPTPSGSTRPGSTQPSATSSEAPPPDTEQPDTVKPETTGTPSTAATPTETSQSPATESAATPSAKPQKKPTAGAPPAATRASDSSSGDDTLAVETANRQFYDSLNRVFAGKTSAMDDVWSHSDRVTYMGPGGGIATGWDEVQAMWDEQAKMKLGGQVDPDELHVTVGGELAIVECYEVGSNRDPLGAPIPVRIRATNSFRKESGQWKMIGHHTDLLPYLAGPLGPTGKPSTSNLSDPGDPADTDSIQVKEDGVKLKLIE
jgi:ketosteroid isomerase-like protein